ncbi:MAG: multicopper oxidase domain-containing protein [Acidobacteriaceae bacterium]|nr:multicopper oxidase domain-containing protein [Acidobacteriaceae bacterium]
MNVTHLRLIIASSACFVLIGPASAVASNPCPRFAPGSTVTQAPDLFSDDGVLTVNLAYQTAPGSNGSPLYCFTTPEGAESPTLHVFPGDTLIVNVTNTLPTPTTAGSMTPVTTASTVCGATVQNASSVNVHYHGTNTSPSCHSDEVIHTLINSGQTFQYRISFPSDEPPGLYWYHPHVHGLAETAVQGGASAAIVVRGIANVQPAVAGLPEQIFLVRDQQTPPNSPPIGSTLPGGGIQPSWDLSVNYVQILASNGFIPAQLRMKPGQRQFWRVSNSCADTILDLQLVYDGVPQTMQVVGLDGVPTGSQDGTRRGTLVPVTDIRVPPASRVEFIMTGPSASVKSAIFQTLNINTGPDGDTDPQRPIIAIQTNPFAPDPAATIGPAGTPGPQRFEGLASATPTATRTLYFSEINANQQFFITVDGQTPTLFSPNNPPAITTTQGSVEDWIIQNRSLENHEFHLHQVHFLLLERNGVPVPPSQQQFLDMVEVPFGTGAPPYPSVKVRADFRGPDIGDFVYHCHILNHEDNGMMAIIRVLPNDAAAKPANTVPPAVAKPQTKTTAVALLLTGRKD